MRMEVRYRHVYSGWHRCREQYNGRAHQLSAVVVHGVIRVTDPTTHRDYKINRAF